MWSPFITCDFVNGDHSMRSVTHYNAYLIVVGVIDMAPSSVALLV